jgi:RES domain-containing protein
MEVFRICCEAYASELIASGSANRWNRKGQDVIYTGSSRSLSTLELIVHRSAIIPTVKYRVMVIFISDDDSLVHQLRISELPADWRSLRAYSTLQEIGARWYSSQQTLILKVPSAVIPFEYNYIINTKHPDFASKIKLVGSEDYFWDERLF